MPAPYSRDFRQKIADAFAAGRAQAQIARDFGVSSGFVSVLLGHLARTGSVAAKPHAGGRPLSLDEDGRALLADLVRQTPDATLAELADALGATGRPVSRPALSRILIRMGLGRKKSRSTPASATPRASKPSAKSTPRSSS